ncbi:unnamed protein product [Ceutorhynchus assimilis]|uniref:Uncharacterized protein n=1 Tax=Ceutorhynchus assimilis TaxID=467358 RepID=A0A9N9QR95_9CUCU|nr:unnamed protein product [Ceutorhynchus assimilis]
MQSNNHYTFNLLKFVVSSSSRFQVYGMFSYSPFNILLCAFIVSHMSMDVSCASDNKGSYMFNYVIDTGGILSQQTEESHNNVVLGSYSFLQPDGRIRVVRYKADAKKGFIADIKYRKLFLNNKGPLRFPRDFMYPLRLADPVSIIPRHFFESLHNQKKFHG